MFIGDKIEEIRSKVYEFDQYSDYEDILKIQDEMLILFGEARKYAYEDDLVILLKRTDDLIDKIFKRA